MSDLDTSKTNTLQKVSVAMTFVVNEFPRIQIPPRKAEPKEFEDLSSPAQQKLMKRLIDRVKDL